MPKIQILFFFFSFILIVIVIRLFSLQVLSPSSAESSYLKYQKIAPQRGVITDRSGDPLVLNKTMYQLFGEPKKIENRNQIIDMLHEILEIDSATLEARIDMDKVWTPIASRVTKKQKEEIEKRKYAGLGFTSIEDRYYPEASLAAHLLGFVGKDKDGENIGYFGIEGYYDQDLAGLPGLFKSDRDLFGRPILVGNQERIESENGRDLQLTIDKSVQEIVKSNLRDGIERYKARAGCVIVADPYTMELLSLACLPDFDPEHYYESSQDVFKNNAISSLYEPGSTFKPLIVAAALDAQKIKPDDMYDESGPVTIGEYQIRTWNNKYEGKISMTRILEKSSNVGMVYIGEQLGEMSIKKYISEFGFGHVTGIDLQGEASAQLRDTWYPIDYATATFGQGIAVTPIQMVKAFSAVVNGGELLTPHVVKKAVYDGREKVVHKNVERRVISKRTSDIVKQMLVSTVNHGEYKWAVPEGYVIGGKTGTAQIAVRGTYDASKTNASFIGFAPADKPRFVGLVILYEPGTSIYGSETAAPLFFSIAKDLLVYYNIAPGE